MKKALVHRFQLSGVEYFQILGGDSDAENGFSVGEDPGWRESRAHG